MENEDDIFVEDPENTTPEGASEENENSEEVDEFDTVMAALNERLAPKEEKTVAFEKYETVLKQRNELLAKVQKLVLNKDLTVSGQTREEAQKAQITQEEGLKIFGTPDRDSKELSYEDLYKMIKQ